MRSFAVILRHEVFSLFISPATFVVAFYFLALLGVSFRFFLETYPHADYVLPPSPHW